MAKLDSPSVLDPRADSAMTSLYHRDVWNLSEDCTATMALRRLVTGEFRHRVVEMGELTAAEMVRWLELRASNPALDSPYFHPQFAAAVAATRPGVRVILGEDARGVIASFLPVQFDKRACRPAGSPAADFQGPICAPGVDFDIAAALRAAGASSYEFDHMRDGIPAVEPWILGRQQSPYLDVSGGMDGYLSRASRSGKDKVAEARRLTRKAERDHGSVHFVAESADAAVLDTVIALKRRQYAKTGARDYFSDLQHVRLLHRLLETRDADFGGMLSIIYAGPHVLAAHFGLRAGRFCIGGSRCTTRRSPGCPRLAATKRGDRGCT